MASIYDYDALIIMTRIILIWIYAPEGLWLLLCGRVGDSALKSVWPGRRFGPYKVSGATLVWPVGPWKATLGWPCWIFGPSRGHLTRPHLSARLVVT